MGTIVVAFVIIVLALILISVLGVVLFDSESSILDKIISIIFILFSSFIIIITLYSFNRKIEIQGIEKYLNNKVIRTIDYVNYTEENIPKDTVYTYTKINE